MRQGVITAASMLTLAMALAVGGCGGSGTHHSPGTSASERTIKYLGGAYRLASDRLPEGAAFSIVGQRYRFWRRDYIELTVDYAKPGQVEEGGSGWQGGEVLEWGTHAGCERRPFAIFNGILKSPQDQVFLSTGGKLIAMHKTPLPAGLRYRGALVYGIAPALGYSVLIRTPTGKMIDEASGIRFVESSEVCRRTPRSHELRARAARALAPTMRAITDCMRRKGFDVAVASAPEFDTHGINTKSLSFLAARHSCIAAEKGALRHWLATSPGHIEG